jgi:beta-galactosidase
MKKTLLFALALACASLTAADAAQRERIKMDEGWQFALGHAADPAQDFGCATEYFNYFTKVNSIHNEGPYSPQFDASKWSNSWRNVDLPFDWVVDLPFAAEASHSHGYKTVGYRYPETSVGWYRKTFTVPTDDLGRHLHLEFDGIFRNAQVWVNGFYLGHEASGYATQVYDISEYLNYGGDNVIAVRADASREEGWFYEGAGIYRHVWLVKADKVHVAPFGTFVHADLSAPFAEATLTVETTVDNQQVTPARYQLRHTLIDAAGQTVGTATTPAQDVEAKAKSPSVARIAVSQPHLWSPDSPYLYKVRTEVLVDGQTVDETVTPTGIRHIAFTPDEGFLLNGQPLKLKGVNMHQDHPGVGSAIPDALQAYRLRELKKIGVNAYRASHNPMTPEMIDACDSLGILVLEENRLPGVNEEHLRLLRRMIDRDRNHPSIILWSVGNEEWGIEWDIKGTRIAEALREYCHRYDPTRPMCMATSGGPTVVVPTDVAGYNYIHQNPIEEHRRNYPQRCAVGSEETSGCGTRGIYYDDREHGHMASLNRSVQEKDSLYSAIEFGWKYYYDRPWLGGLFYWTGFDYRGEPNPLVYPATGSEFGILDYCGFPKDEAYYLQAWWTSTPVLHLLPHWTLRGHEGEAVSVWAYSNCDEVELYVNGKSAGRKAMPANGHLEWDVTYRPGTLRAVGYKQGRKQLTETLYTALTPSQLSLTADRTVLRADNEDVAVCRLEVLDAKKHFVPDACEEVEISVSGPVRILGVGNGDPAYQADERPTDREARTYRVRTFNGLAQVLIQSERQPGSATVSVKLKDGKESVVRIECREESLVSRE